ncbi:hypothetical protein L6452_02553 [Arctium lappa]|uniref:Uncharacterized protein n=1 Tax=Arctium lappa TaxID=4217 RepID=A0ACB9FJE1_ARCLA|nr:hypothetical protein L6452_02553 [Arctium lappa]
MDNTMDDKEDFDEELEMEESGEVKNAKNEKNVKISEEHGEVSFTHAAVLKPPKVTVSIFTLSTGVRDFKVWPCLWIRKSPILLFMLGFILEVILIS